MSGLEETCAHLLLVPSVVPQHLQPQGLGSRVQGSGTSPGLGLSPVSEHGRQRMYTGREAFLAPMLCRSPCTMQPQGLPGLMV